MKLLGVADALINGVEANIERGQVSVYCRPTTRPGNRSLYLAPQLQCACLGISQTLDELGVESRVVEVGNSGHEQNVRER
jgi:hypothetical protein